MVVRNQYLFAQAYLDQVMADPGHDEAAATLGQGLADWAPFRDDDSLSTLIDSWVGPVLDILAFHHQPVEREPGLQKLYSDLTGQQLLALCLVLPPGADIDNTVKGAHHAFEIVDALRQESCTWGVLTDGSRWRLVKADVIRPYESYLEVNLGQVKARPSAETVRVFHAFFRRDVFVAGEEGKTPLDEHLARSEEVAESIQDHLREKMESVLGALCRGFVMADGRESYTEEQRAEIFDNATYLLYRILFILYAEARSLLPAGNPAYDDIGMERLVKQAVRYHEEGVPEQIATTLWNGLRRLSKAIYESDEARGVPAYNGGLFSDEDTEDFSKGYLRDCFISDPHLASALVDLTQIPSTKTPDAYQAIDYRDLSVRALGGLYEGMLEYRLFLAEQKTYGIPDGKGGYHYKPASEVKRPKRTYRMIDAGDVYFAQSPTQRKATGSYYTPEYIVDYIVKQTVERGLRERREPLESKLTSWSDEVHGALDDAERKRLQNAVDRELMAFVEGRVLTFRVCDPAMGSGHFLVNAAHTIANFIVETLNLAPWENAELDSDPVHWRRRLIESCIYGVDLNPLAVELGKLSLWLASVAEAKPLNFLDHHLKVGNSLIGAWVEDLGSPPVTGKPRRKKELKAEQLSYFDQSLGQILPTLLGKALEISERPSDSMEDIRGKQAAEQAVEDLTAPFKTVADLWTSAYFGNSLMQEEYDQALEGITDSKQLPYLPAAERALQIAKMRRFFHWELEFPEVFYQDSNRGSNPGFDALAGNPPYGQKGTLTPDERKWARKNFESTSSGNIAELFTERGLDLTRSKGYFSFILPKKVTFGFSWTSLRHSLLSGNRILSAADVSQAFEKVLLEQAILAVQKQATSQKSIPILTSDGTRLHQTCRVPAELYTDSLFPLWREDYSAALHRKLWEVSDPLAHEHCHVYMGLGSVTSKFTTDPAHRPCVRGRQIGRYKLSSLDSHLPANTPIAQSELELMSQPKVIMQTIVAHVPKPDPHIIITAAIDHLGLLVHDTVSYLVQHRYENGYLAAILNSRLLSFYCYRFVFNYAVRTMHFIEPYARRMPLRRISFLGSHDERARLAHEWSELLHSYERLSTDQSYGPFLSSNLGRWLGSRLETDLDETVAVHDLLAHLAEQMTDMNNEKQNAAKEFSNWVVRYTGLDVDEWTLKTRVTGYWEHGWDELQRALRRNRNAIEKASGRDVESESTLRTIQDEFGQSMARLQPLLHRIASTDRLIDLIVYRLYGLTEEEVAIVEGSK